jgi:NADPH:quinone reductase-like Zn-dependent oxidoreductase
MRAIVCRGYGPPDVLEIKEIPKPSPADDEVLIRVRATTVTSGDWRVRSLIVPAGFGLMSRLALGLFRPRQPILGTELSGDVEAVGKNVTTFAVGDPVFAFPGLKMGAYVEYKCMPQNGMVARKPARLSYEEAAALSFGGTTALDFFRRGNLRAGDKVLVNGASGAVGTAAVQLARQAGAEVTGVCGPDNLELVRSLGAHDVIDYRKQDFTKDGRTYDIIVDTAGTAPFSRCKDSLKEGGRLLVVLGSLGAALGGPLVSLTSSKRVVAGTVAENPEDLRKLAELAEAGAFNPVIDRTYSFEQMVEAHTYVDAGHKKGNVVVGVMPPL